MERPTASAATTALAPAQPRYRRVPLEPLASSSLHLQKLRVPRGARRLRIHRPRKALRDVFGAFMAGVARDVGRSLLLYWLRARWNGRMEGGGGSRIFSRSDLEYSGSSQPLASSWHSIGRVITFEVKLYFGSGASSSI